MAELATVPILLAVLASYVLVLLASRKRRPANLVAFLFSGNTTGLAVSSGVGSLFSVSIACTALLSAGYLYGWQILLSSVAGTLIGTFLLVRLSRSPAVSAFKARQATSGPTGGASYLVLLAEENGRGYPVTLALLLVGVYTGILASELAVLRVTSASLIPLEFPELLAVLIMVVGICFSYVFIGGYRAVLLTDHFQVIVIAGFFGMLCGEVDWSTVDWGLLASPRRSALAFPTLGHQLALHFASFAGSACIVFGSADHWFRTIGTLAPRQGRIAIVASSILGSFAGSLLVITGTYYSRLHEPHAAVAGQGSLQLLSAVVGLGSRSLTFMFFAALACVALTTIDTYMITQQQLYYEFVCRFAAKSARGYVLEYALRWRQVRGIGLLLLAAAFGLSLCVPSDKIYAVGVAALSTPMAFAPLFLPEALSRHGHRKVARAIRYPTLAVSLSFVLWGLLVKSLESTFGSASTRLYLIPLGLAVAAILGYVASLLFGVLMRSRAGVHKA